MNDADRTLAGIAAAQRQVFTRAQCRDVGLRSCDVAYRIQLGLFVPVGTHTLTFVGVVLDWRGQLQARTPRPWP